MRSGSGFNRRRRCDLRLGIASLGGAGAADAGRARNEPGVGRGEVFDEVTGADGDISTDASGVIQGFENPPILIGTASRTGVECATEVAYTCTAQALIQEAAAEDAEKGRAAAAQPLDIT